MACTPAGDLVSEHATKEAADVEVMRLNAPKNPAPIINHPPSEKNLEPKNCSLMKK